MPNYRIRDASTSAPMRDHLDHVMPVLEPTRQLRPEFFTSHLGARSPRQVHGI
jgi:hypothetical protein